jgi:tRNA(Ile)-lysidine synthase
MNILQDLHRRVSAFIQAEGLLGRGDTVLVALSGGADSVCLLRLLRALEYPVVAAHCHFHLRGEESDRDERFVVELCRQLDVPLQVRHFRTVEYARAHRLSIEMAARELRYGWFSEIKAQVKADAIAVAHHRDDHVETLLLNLVRGTGLHGLTGIAPRNGQGIIRPLLCVDRTEILAYLQALHQPFVTDSTNLQDTYRRNKIRLQVLPLLRQLNPSIVRTLDDTARRLRQAEAVYQAGIGEGMQRVLLSENEISIPRLLQEPSPSALLHELLYPRGFNAAQIADILASTQAQSGRRFLAKEWELWRDRDRFLLRRRVGEDPMKHSDPVPELQVEEVTVTPAFQIPRDRGVACLDADRVKLPLTVRHPRPGDRFVPFGMRGSQLLSDYFTNHKFSAFRKQQQWVVCSGDDIVWLADERPDGRFCLSSSTRKALIISLKVIS